MSDQNQDQSANVYAMRHSLAHITATAIQKIWPQAKFGVGPVVEHGFYYDIDMGKDKLSEEDFEKIEAAMQEVVKADVSFERFTKGIDEAIAWAKEQKQPYKQELLNDLKREGTTVAKDLDSEEIGLNSGGESKVKEVSFYRNGE